MIDNFSDVLLHFIAERIKCLLYDSTERELALFSSDITPYVFFAFVDFMLYPFTAINHSYEYDYMVSLMSVPSESSNVGWSWGPPRQLVRQ